MLYLVVFICGAVVMALELMGSRLLMPYLGGSIYVWTSLIGVILACLSIGYWWGGKIADRNPTRKILSLIIFGAAVLTAILPVIESPVLRMVQLTVPDLRVAAVLATVILFAPAGILLGMVSPYAIRLKLESVDNSGSTIGRFYAVSTTGSILGTFAAGFFFIPNMNSVLVITLLAFTLLIASILAAPGWLLSRSRLIASSILIFCLAVLFYGAMFDEGTFPVIKNSRYHHITVEEYDNLESGETIRNMKIDPFLVQTKLSVQKPRELQHEYLKAFDMMWLYQDQIDSVLMLGGGAYAYPQYFAGNFPEILFDVVEIDPELLNLAKEYFFYQESDSVQIYHGDARRFIRGSERSYDVVLIDIFGSGSAIPFYLGTREFFAEVLSVLTTNGLVMMNTIGSPSGDTGKLFRALYHTLIAAGFNHVQVFAMNPTIDPLEIQNIILVASSELVPLENVAPRFEHFLKRQWKGEIPKDVPILTDAFSPVEALYLPVMQKMFRERQVLLQQ